MDDFELELKQDFLEESVDLLSDAESTFLDLESNRDDPELLNKIFRLAHNLKGTSKAVGFDQVAEVTHIAENLILKLKEGELEVTDNVVTILLEFKDKITEMIETLKEDIETTFDVAPILKKLEETTNGTGASIIETVIKVEDTEVEANELPVQAEENDNSENELFASLRADGFDTDVIDQLESAAQGDFEDIDGTDSVDSTENTNSDNTVDNNSALMESLLADGFDKGVVANLKKEMAAKADGTYEEPSLQAEPVAEVKQELKPEVKKAEVQPKKKSTKTNKKEVDESIRVSLSKIDKINNMIGELVILQTVLNQRRFEFIGDDLSNKSISMMGKLFKEAQELAMSLRMLPLKSTFQKMTRTVRDTANALDKKVKLHLIGEETEVDKTVLEKLADPLVHIIRNAVDHGLESNEDRVMKDKSEVGNVELMAYHEGSNLVIQVTDDGKGIDPQVIRAKALEKGVIDEHTVLSDHEVIQLIFHPGFSTKEQVTEVSGRGVGMDVVKTNIESLGGEVNLMSKLGEGSSFKIVLPLTLAIIEGIIIKAKEEQFIVPLTQIHEITQVTENQIERFTGSYGFFKLRGDVLPLFYLNGKLGFNDDLDKERVVVVVKGSNFTFGVVIDDVSHQQQIVIKKVSDDVKSMKGIIGSAIMGDGKPAFILDLIEIFHEDLKASKSHKKLKRELLSA